jgi:hypothetical protein
MIHLKNVNTIHPCNVFQVEGSHPSTWIRLHECNVFTYFKCIENILHREVKNCRPVWVFRMLVAVFHIMLLLSEQSSSNTHHVCGCLQPPVEKWKTVRIVRSVRILTRPVRLVIFLSKPVALFILVRSWHPMSDFGDLVVNFYFGSQSEKKWRQTGKV